MCMLPLLQGQCGDKCDHRHLNAVPDADGAARPDAAARAAAAAAAAVTGFRPCNSQPDSHPWQPEAAQLHHCSGRADIPGCGARDLYVISSVPCTSFQTSVLP